MTGSTLPGGSSTSSTVMFTVIGGVGFRVGFTDVVLAIAYAQDQCVGWHNLVTSHTLVIQAVAQRDLALVINVEVF